MLFWDMEADEILAMKCEDNWPEERIKVASRLKQGKVYIESISEITELTFYEILNLPPAEPQFNIFFDSDFAQIIKQELKISAEKKTLKIAENLKEKGVDVNTIAEVTGLTVDDILHL